MDEPFDDVHNHSQPDPLTLPIDSREYADGEDPFATPNLPPEEQPQIDEISTFDSPPVLEAPDVPFPSDIVPDDIGHTDQPPHDWGDGGGIADSINILATEDPTFELPESAPETDMPATQSPPVGTTYGNPETDESHWHMQTHPDTCAVVSQEYIIKSFKHEDLDENDLVNEAINNGYYFPGQGTPLCDVGNLLEDHGIPIERGVNNHFQDLIDKLRNGQKVIVGVDAGEIWHNSPEEQLKDLFFVPEANHAVEVIGYDDSTGHIILNDPGNPEGRGYEVSKEDFLDAWDDSNNFMVWTENPAPKSFA